jgi:hypothetical protein
MLLTLFLVRAQHLVQNANRKQHGVQCRETRVSVECCLWGESFIKPKRLHQQRGSFTNNFAKQEIWIYLNIFAGTLLLHRIVKKSFVRPWVLCPHKWMNKPTLQTGLSYSCCLDEAVKIANDTECVYFLIIMTGICKISSLQIVRWRGGGLAHIVGCNFVRWSLIPSYTLSQLSQCSHTVDRKLHISSWNSSSTFDCKLTTESISFENTIDTKS